MEKGDEDWVTWQVFQVPNSNYLVQIYTFLPSYFQILQVLWKDGFLPVYLSELTASTIHS